MRKLTMTMAALAAVTLSAAPLAAQDAPAVTMEEAGQCMMATLPFMMVAVVNNPEGLEELGAAGEFWASLADGMGEATDDQMAAMNAESEKMLADFEALQSEADMAGFVAPYQAAFDACEEKRKALQAG
jgi:hypothetical protein